MCVCLCACECVFVRACERVHVCVSEFVYMCLCKRERVYNEFTGCMYERAQDVCLTEAYM